MIVSSNVTHDDSIKINQSCQYMVHQYTSCKNLWLITSIIRIIVQSMWLSNHHSNHFTPPPTAGTPFHTSGNFKSFHASKSVKSPVHQVPPPTAARSRSDTFWEPRVVPRRCWRVPGFPGSPSKINRFDGQSYYKLD